MFFFIYFFSINNNNQSGLMTQTMNEDDDPNRHNNFHQFFINPFEYKRVDHESSFSLEKYIKNWVESIFCHSKRVGIQDKIDIHRKITQQKSFQHSSSSIIYSIIRDTVEGIVWKLRNVVDHSFGVLKNCKPLCKLSQTSSSWELNWMQFKCQEDPQSFKNIYPPISNMYITFYKYLCQASKEVYNLWKTIYQYLPVKDLKCQTFQQSISELILQVFTAGNTLFKPKNMLPVISLANKCKFVNVDKEASLKRMNLTKFKEDELAINLAKASAKKLKQMGINPEENAILKARFAEERKNPFRAREKGQTKQTPSNVHRLTPRSKIDTDLIEEIRNQYLNSYKLTQNLKENIETYKNVIERISTENNTDQKQPFQTVNIFGSYGLEVEDESSQQDDLNDLECDEKDELIEENEEVEVEQAPFYERKENEASAKLSASTEVEEDSGRNDIIFKNEEFQNPPDFFLQEEYSSIDPYQIEDKDEKLTLQFSQKYISKVETKLSRDFTGKHEEIHLCPSHKNVEKSRKRISKQHDKEKQKDHSKCCLEEQKQKLETYRKELEKEKEELMRQVERFMKEKEKDTNLYKRIATNHYSKCHKHSKNCCRYTQQIKQLDFNRYRTTFKHHDQDLVDFTRGQLQKHGAQYLSRIVSREEDDFCDEQSTGEATVNSQESYMEEFQNEKKLSKRQQKLRKKIQREMKQFKNKESQVINSAKQQEPISQEEQQLTQFLQNLNLSKTNRVTWHIEESQLEKWKNKVSAIRQKSVKDYTVKEVPQSKQSKKKKKNRHRN